MQNDLVGVVFEVSEQHVKLYELSNQFMGFMSHMLEHKFVMWKCLSQQSRLLKTNKKGSVAIQSHSRLIIKIYCLHNIYLQTLCVSLKKLCLTHFNCHTVKTPTVLGQVFF